MFSFLTLSSQLLINEEQICKIRGARIKTRFPPTLVVLAIKAVAKNCALYIEMPDTQLQFLRTCHQIPE